MEDQTRQRPAVPAHERFLQHASDLQHLGMRERFARIYETNLWGSEVSVSGSGSVEEQTAAIRAQLPVLLRDLAVSSMLDLPCGDFGWMRTVDLSGIHYHGADIVPKLIEQHRRDFETSFCQFAVLDISKDPLPTVDLVLCRDCFVHLSIANVWKALSNLKKSGSKWLLTTTFPNHRDNADIEDGDWRLLNFECPPFSFPPPTAALNERCTEHDGAFADKSLGLWPIAEVPEGPTA